MGSLKHNIEQLEKFEDIPSDVEIKSFVEGGKYIYYHTNSSRGSESVMRPETKIVKDALRKEFPGCKVNIVYITAYNYAFSDDKLIIRIDVPYDAVRKFLVENSYKIRIMPKGSMSSAVNNFDQTLFGQDTDIGFIEVDSTANTQ